MRFIYISITTFLFLPVVCIARADLIDDIETKLEQYRIERLVKVQSEPENKLANFTTDGCSGGMSDGWQYVATLFPQFKNKFGDVPPWQQCCIQHDKIYWRGETEDGFSKRLAADRALRQCVVDLGNQKSKEFSQEFNISPEQIETSFEVAGELMYRAVRIGGKPCTIFPWRWGYGWPACPVVIEE